MISRKTRHSPEGWHRVTTEEQNVPETSLGHYKRDGSSGEAMGTKLRANYVPKLYITQVIHSTNIEGLGGGYPIWGVWIK